MELIHHFKSKINIEHYQKKERKKVGLAVKTGSHSISIAVSSKPPPYETEL